MCVVRVRFECLCCEIIATIKFNYRLHDPSDAPDTVSGFPVKRVRDDDFELCHSMKAKTASSVRVNSNFLHFFFKMFPRGRPMSFRSEAVRFSCPRSLSHATRDFLSRNLLCSRSRNRFLLIDGFCSVPSFF